MKKFLLAWVLLAATYLTGCASVPMDSPEQDILMKEFAAPENGNAGLYIYRNSNFGGALKKNLYIDKEFIGESAPMTYFYQEVGPGEHTLSTESEFSDNDLKIQVESGQNYFVRQYIKMGLFVGGANLERVPESEGQSGVRECKLANSRKLADGK